MPTFLVGAVVGGTNISFAERKRHGEQLRIAGNYLSEAISKVGAKNRVEAARLARERVALSHRPLSCSLRARIRLSSTGRSRRAFTVSVWPGNRLARHAGANDATRETHRQ